MQYLYNKFLSLELSEHCKRSRVLFSLYSHFHKVLRGEELIYNLKKVVNHFDSRDG